jgi:hypothetical protein
MLSQDHQGNYHEISSVKGAGTMWSWLGQTVKLSARLPIALSANRIKLGSELALSVGSQPENRTTFIGLPKTAGNHND